VIVLGIEAIVSKTFTVSCVPTGPSERSE